MQDFIPFTKTSPYILAELSNLPEIKINQYFSQRQPTTHERNIIKTQVIYEINIAKKIPARALRSVDFPDLAGPMITVIVPGNA